MNGVFDELQIPSDLPSVRTYLAELPDALDSFPECGASRDLLEALQQIDVYEQLRDLTDRCTALRPAIEPGAWIPEVEYVVLLLAIRDRFFDGDDHVFLEWLTELNARRMARITFPSLHGNDAQRLAGDVPALWSLHHRGTSMHPLRLGPGAAEIALDHPAGLFPPVVVEYFARALAVAIVRVDGAQPEISTITTVDGALARTILSVHWRAG